MIVIVVVFVFVFVFVVDRVIVAELVNGNEIVEVIDTMDDQATIS